ncbi:hypothetical protein FrEUN1fDRAFT_7960 [Parafrankia sp. EUN1f]|nr:hypothetical protein FrEUN1fDRAFT_7960 [Parafrankia sp. EUN1f]
MIAIGLGTDGADNEALTLDEIDARVLPPGGRLSICEPLLGQRSPIDLDGLSRHDLAADAGVRQFLDIGPGLPAEHATHQIAQQVAPQSRIVYVDNDPIVLA